MVKRKYIDPEDVLLDGIIEAAKNSSTACDICKHFNGKHGCTAFPDQIPVPILTGQVPHTKTMYGQKNKIIFEQLE